MHPDLDLIFAFKTEWSLLHFIVDNILIINECAPILKFLFGNIWPFVSLPCFLAFEENMAATVGDFHVRINCKILIGWSCLVIDSPEPSMGLPCIHWFNNRVCKSCLQARVFCCITRCRTCAIQTLSCHFTMGYQHTHDLQKLIHRRWHSVVWVSWASQATELWITCKKIIKMEFTSGYMA